jgi:transitional endoplasmic reticulum ATPase
MPVAGDVDLDRVAAETERYTGADLEGLVRRAGLAALREDGDLHMRHFEQALAESHPSVTPEMERDYEQIASRLKQDAAAMQPIGFGMPSPEAR